MTKLEAAQVLKAVRAQNRDRKCRVGCDSSHSMVWDWYLGPGGGCLFSYSSLLYNVACVKCARGMLTALQGYSCCSVDLTEYPVLCKSSYRSSPPQSMGVFKPFRGKKIH